MSTLEAHPSTAAASATAAPANAGDTSTAGNPARTLSTAASATLLVLAVFSAFVITVGDSARSLHAGVGGETWALSGMALGLATALLTAGALADDLGHRRVLIWSAGMLAAASALGAVAPNTAVLVAARVLQGVAGGGVLAASLGSIGRAFPAGPARTRATGVWGAAVGAGITVGPLVAAGLVEPLGWRSGFWLEVAGAAAVMIAAMTLAESRPTARRPLDLPAITTLGAGMALLTEALVEAHHGWTRPATVALLAAAALLLTAFAAVELGQRRPMLDPRLFAAPKFFASITGALFTGLAVIGLMSYSPTFLQGALRLSALTLASGAGPSGLIRGWNTAALVSAGLCAIGALMVASCRPRQRPRT
jgi:MFS family permease